MNRAVFMQHEGEHKPDEQNQASCVPEHIFGVHRQSVAATALWIKTATLPVSDGYRPVALDHHPKRRRRCALPAHSKF